MKITIGTLSPTSYEGDLIVWGVREGQVAADVAALEGAFGNRLAASLANDDFTGKAGKGIVYPCFNNLKAKQIAIVGTGDGGVEGVRAAAGRAGYEARIYGARTVVLALGQVDARGAGAAAHAFTEGNYRFEKYKREDTRKAPAEVVTLVANASANDLTNAMAVQQGQAFARDLVNEPAAEVYPESLAAAAVGLKSDRISVDVWDVPRMTEAGMGGILGVGQGSVRPPRFVHLHYKPAGKPKAKLGLVGKGVTFDSGGLSLKTSAGMQTMRCDMGGAASVLGTFKAISICQPDVEVHGMVPTVENMPSGNSYKLGDVLRMANGKTVEIHNTDAEGRLILADALHFGSGLGLDAMVDMATLTGACVVALGDEYSGLFSKDDALAARLEASAKAAGEFFWRMPMPDSYKEALKGDWGQLKNVTGKPGGGAITAALFLSEFVQNVPWAHLDIAGPAFFEKTVRHYAPGGTGTPVPTLTEWILGYAR